MGTPTSGFDADAHPEPRFVAVGRVVKPHGLRGEVQVKVLTENERRFAAGSELFAGLDVDKVSPVSVASSRYHKTGLRVRFSGFDDPANAETLRGMYLFVPVAELRRLGEDEFWEHELIGLAVRHVDGSELGILAAVIERPGPDLWTIETGRGGVLFPAAKELVRRVDLKRRVVIVDPPEGLF